MHNQTPSTWGQRIATLALVSTLSVAATTESRRARFWKAIGRSDIPLDPRFASPATVAQNYAAFCTEIEKTLQQKTALEWEEIVSDAGVAAMAVRDLHQAIDNPQIRRAQSRGKFRCRNQRAHRRDRLSWMTSVRLERKPASQ